MTYQLHHLCIYETKPRDAMWGWLRWNHSLPAYYWGGADFHLTDEGHVDYTFLACGAPYQVQLEAPPYQFAYERSWFDSHGSGINHVCWIVENAKESFEHLGSAGCDVVQGYTEFGVYNGFVSKDPEGRWIEVMEYTRGFKTPDVEFRPVGVRRLQALGMVQLCADLDEMVDWYVDVLGQRVLLDARGSGGLAYLVDDTYDRRQCVNVLAESTSDAELALLERHGPCISTVLYHADDVEGAYADAVAAGFDAVAPVAPDERIGASIGTLREPSGNLVQVRERLSSARGPGGEDT